MISIAHYGIYCNNLEKMETFYKNVFSLVTVVEKQIQDDEIIQELLKEYDNGILQKKRVHITKLITEKGVAMKDGDMLELIQLDQPLNNTQLDCVFRTGTIHCCFRVVNIENIKKLIIENGGEILSQIYLFPNGNKCFFARDIEGNFLEIIERNALNISY